MYYFIIGAINVFFEIKPLIERGCVKKQMYQMYFIKIHIGWNIKYSISDIFKQKRYSNFNNSLYMKMIMVAIIGFLVIYELYIIRKI